MSEWMFDVGVGLRVLGGEWASSKLFNRTAKKCFSDKASNLLEVAKKLFLTALLVSFLNVGSISIILSAIKKLKMKIKNRTVRNLIVYVVVPLVSLPVAMLVLAFVFVGIQNYREVNPSVASEVVNKSDSEECRAAQALARKYVGETIDSREEIETTAKILRAGCT